MKAGRFVIPAMLLFALLAVPLTLYVVGYLWLGEANHITFMHDSYVAGGAWVENKSIERVYSQEWQMHFFKLGGRVETRLRGYDVHVAYRTPLLDAAPIDVEGAEAVDQ